MTPFMLSFSITVVGYFWQPCLLLAMFYISLIILYLQSYFIATLLLIGLILGCSLSGYQDNRSRHSCLDKYYNQKILVAGKVSDIPQYTRYSERFYFLIDKIGQTACQVKTRLNWYGKKPYLRANDRWHLWVKFNNKRHPHFPGLERWLRSQGVQAQGYVVGSLSYRHSQYHRWYTSIDGIRQKIAVIIHHAVPQRELAATLVALTTGSRHLLRQEHWHVFQATGTSHLVAISGLHVSLVAGLFYFLIDKLWRLFPALLKVIPVQRIAGVASLVFALLYSLLAGFSIPTQRALIMLAVMILGEFSWRHIPLWYRLLLAFTLILVVWPLAALSVSFWLSFFAVAMIGFIISARLGATKGIGSWLSLQSKMFIGLFPITILFFQKVSLLMIFANLVAIPYVSFLVVPACLLATGGFVIFPTFDHWLWWLAAKTLWPLWWYLAYLAHFPFALWHATYPSQWAFLMVSLGALLLLSPKGFPGKGFSLVFLSPLLFML